MPKPPSRFAFQRQMAAWGYGFAAFETIREKIATLQHCIDEAERDPRPYRLQLLGDMLSRDTDPAPALKITWPARNSFERKCWAVRPEYAEQLIRIRSLLADLSGNPRFSRMVTY